MIIPPILTYMTKNYINIKRKLKRSRLSDRSARPTYSQCPSQETARDISILDACSSLLQKMSCLGLGAGGAALRKRRATGIRQRTGTVNVKLASVFFL